MTDQAPAVTVDTDDRSVLTRLAVRSADIARNWRISRLSLRTRVLLMFSLGALLLAVFLSAAAYSFTRSSLGNRRDKAAVAEATSHAGMGSGSWRRARIPPRNGADNAAPTSPTTTR